MEELKIENRTSLRESEGGAGWNGVIRLYAYEKKLEICEVFPGGEACPKKNLEYEKYCRMAKHV